MENPENVNGASANRSKTETFTRNFDDVLLSEHSDILARRAVNKIHGDQAEFLNLVELGKAQRQAFRSSRKEPDAIFKDTEEIYARSKAFETVGLALSGGGIRSGSFALGALQSLASKGLLERVDYISTVSGGGYTGIASTIAMDANGGAFPFTTKNEYRDTEHMRILRDNANYLKFGQALPMLHNVSILLRGMITNLLLVLSTLLLLAAFTLWANPDIASLSLPGFVEFDLPFPWFLKNSPFGLSILVAAGAVLLFVIWSLWKGISTSFENFSEFLGAASAFALVLLAFTAFLELQPWMQRQFMDQTTIDQNRIEVLKLKNVPSCMVSCDFLMGDGIQDTFATIVSAACADKKAQQYLCTGAAVAKTVPEIRPLSLNWFIGIFQTAIAPLLAAVALAAKQLADILKSNETKSGFGAFLKRATSKAILVAAALALPLLLLLTYHRLVFWGLLSTANDRVSAPFAPAWLSYIAAHSQVGNVVHAFSCSYLMLGLAAFLIAFFAMLNPNSNSLHGLYRGRLANAFCAPFMSGGQMKFSDLDPNNGPTHIVNATLNIQSSEEANRRGRDAEFFAFARNYVGSKITGYAATDKYEEAESSLDLPTAMAISGAAASSNMGANTLGRLRFTLALLNVRLGSWMLNPRVVLERRALLGRPIPTFFIQELLGKLDESTPKIYLTDGGHIENLGVYELLRRRNKLIIVVEAEADSEMTFAALAILQRYARIDLGVRIEMERSCIRHEKIGDQASKKAQSVHCALGSIDYGPDVNGVNMKGVMLYVKSSLSGDENDYIKDYKRRNQDFPQETTADQLFDEEQFEVYRALGFHAMDGALTGKQLVQTSGNKLESLLDQRSVDERIDDFRRLLGLVPLLKIPEPVVF